MNNNHHSCHSHWNSKKYAINITCYAIPHKVTIREDRKIAQFSLKVANDATILALCAFSTSMINSILYFLPPCDLFIFMTTIKICQKRLIHKLVVKAIISYFRQFMTENAN